MQLVILLLAGASASRRRALERRLASGGPDPLLDEEGLGAQLLAARSLSAPSAPLFFYVVVRHALRDAGIDDAHLADYLGALLLEFGERDRARRVDWNDDAHHAYLTDVMQDLAASAGERRFRVMVHLGNYALWLAGMYPDYIEARRARHGGPDVSYYDTLGRQGFDMAAEHALADQLGLDTVLRAAATRYPAVRVVLNQLSDRLLFPHASTPGRIMRQLGAH